MIPKVAASITEIYPLIKEMGYDYLVLLIHQGGVNVKFFFSFLL